MAEGGRLGVNETSNLFENDKSLPIDWENSGRLSLLNTSAVSDETLDTRKKVPKLACSMPDLSGTGAGPRSLSITSSGRLTPSCRPMTLREYETQLSDLKKENFNLKLRIHFLQKDSLQLDPASVDLVTVNLNLKVDLERHRTELEKRDAYIKQYNVELEKRAKKHRQEMQGAKEEINLLRVQLNVSQQRISDLEKELRRRQEELLSADESADTSSISFLDDRERQMMDLKTMVATTEWKLKEAKEREKELEEEVERLRADQQCPRTPRAELTGLEEGTLVTSPGMEELVRSLEAQLEVKSAELARLHNQSPSLSCHSCQEFEDKLKEKCQQLSKCEEQQLKSVKMIQGLLKKMDCMRRGEPDTGLETVTMSRQKTTRSEPDSTTEQMQEMKTPVTVSRKPLLEETLADATAATELFNRSLNATQDLANVRDKLYILRRVCERLFGKLKGSAEFLRNLLLQLGGKDVADELIRGIQELQAELEDSLNATDAVVDDCHAAEGSLGELASDLDNLSRRLSQSPFSLRKEVLNSNAVLRLRQTAPEEAEIASKLASVKQDLLEYQQSVETMTKESAGLKAELAVQKEQMDQERTQLGQDKQTLSAQVNALSAKVAELKEKLSKSQTESQSLKKELAAVKQDLLEYQQSVETMTMESAGLKAELQANSNAVLRLRQTAAEEAEIASKLASVKQDLLDYHQSVETMTKESAGLKAELAVQAGLKAELAVQKERLDQERTQLGQDKRTLSAQVSALSAEVAELKEKLSKSQTASQSLKKQLASVKQDLLDYQQSVETMTKESAIQKEQMHQERTQLGQDKRTLSAQVSALSAEVAELKEELSKTQTASQSLEKELAAVKQDLLDYQQSVETSTGLKAELAVQKEQMDQERKQLGQDKQTLSVQVSVMSAEVAELKEELSKTQTASQSLKKQLQASKATAEKSPNVSKIIEQLERNNVELKKRLEEDSKVSEELTRRVEEVDRLRDQLTSAQHLLASTQERLQAKSLLTDDVQDGIVKELAKIRMVLQQSRKDLDHVAKKGRAKRK